MDDNLFRIRRAEESDVEAILDIYEPYVTDTTVTFEYSVPDCDLFIKKFRAVTEKYPWIVAELDGRVIGYAYADIPFSARSAYAWDVDVSIYLDQSHTGKGVGRALYTALHRLLVMCGYKNAYALITGENTRSMRFHESFGYRRVGVMKKSGYKFGRWLDVAWYEYSLAERLPSPALPIPFPKLEKENAEDILRGE